MSLTDDWVNGDLFGCFWCKHPDGHIEAHQLTGFKHNNPMKIEVIGPCKYEELQTNQDKEIESLRELLKECLIYIPYSYPQFQTEKRIDLDSAKLNLITRINAAINESEK